MIKELTERAQYIELCQKQLIQSINRIKSNAKYGIGSDALLSEKHEKKILAGTLDDLSKNKDGGKGGEKKKETPSQKNPALD
jgi:hypothetical protein